VQRESLTVNLDDARQLDVFWSTNMMVQVAVEKNTNAGCQRRGIIGGDDNSKNAPNSSGVNTTTNMSVLVFSVIVGAIVLFLLTVTSLTPSSNPTAESSLMVTKRQGDLKTKLSDPTATTTVESQAASTTITSPLLEIGTLASIPYYRCSSFDSSSATAAMIGTSESGTMAKRRRHIVLLHGSAFTKENWKTSGILDRFCGSRSSSSIAVVVTALDLPVTAKHADLMAILNAMGPNDLPVAALVTPSASGTTVLDGIFGNAKNKNSMAELKGRVERWIPVATNALNQYSVAQLQNVGIGRDWPILAIYGDQDKPGKRSSELLRDGAGAVVVQLPGRHPVYLDAPDAFVKTIFHFLDS
jgi:hypothetical protein